MSVLMNTVDKQYHDLLKYVLENGTYKKDRTGVGTKSIFGYQMRFDLQEGFPILTTKKIYWHGVVEELLWFLRAETNIKSLVEKNVHIWNAWAKKNGELGPIYGYQWRKWPKENGHVDQIKNIIEEIKKNPNSRRLVVNSWNVSQIDEMALPPCHTMFQFYVADNRLSCQLYQRSADIFLGLPFNIASYSLLTHMIAQICDLEVGDFVHSIGDAHVYMDHLDQINEQLKRNSFELPKLKLNKEIKNIDDFKSEDIKIENYQHHPAIKASVAV